MSSLVTNYNSVVSKMPFVICNVKHQKIGISTEFVKELVILPKVTPLPNLPAEVRGIFNCRGSVIKVFDLRMRLEMESSLKELDEMIIMLHQREQDHKNWLNELYLSTTENRPFKLTTDPHKCAFGKWYDKFTTANYALSAQLEKFDAPHKIIHSIAFEIEKLKSENKFEEAIRTIERTRNNELKVMIQLFEETRQIIVSTHREIAVILEVSGKSTALAVDNVESVEHIAEDSVKPISSDIQKPSIVHHLAKRAGSEQFIYLLDPLTL